MCRVPAFPVEETVRVVLSIWAGEVSAAEVAGRIPPSVESASRVLVPFAPCTRAVCDSVGTRGGPGRRRSRARASGVLQSGGRVALVGPISAIHTRPPPSGGAGR